MRELIHFHGRGRHAQQRLADLFPETAQPLHAVFRRIARNDGGVDRSDRNSCHQVRMQVSFGERLIDAALIRAESPAALQH
jgi:hypothetical protein